MENESKDFQRSVLANIIINIHGDNTQILPNAAVGAQYFCGGDFVGMRTCPCASAGGGKPAEEEPVEDEALRIARGTLCIYYTDKGELDAIIRRISECRNASDLANLVVNDMRKHTILTDERMVSKDFICALKHFLTFTTGASVGNIRAQINKAMRG